MDQYSTQKNYHDREEERRIRYATLLTEKCGRDGMTLTDALEKMFERNYFGMMMVETGDADAMPRLPQAVIWNVGHNRVCCCLTRH